MLVPVLGFGVGLSGGLVIGLPGELSIGCQNPIQDGPCLTYSLRPFVMYGTWLPVGAALLPWPLSLQGAAPLSRIPATSLLQRCITPARWVKEGGR